PRPGGLLPGGTSGNRGDGRSGDPVANLAGSRSDRAVRGEVAFAPCELDFRSSILMKQKDKDLSRLFSKTAPKKWGRARAGPGGARGRSQGPEEIAPSLALRS